MSFEHSPIQNEVDSTTRPLSIEGEDGVEVIPTFAGLKSFQEAINVHHAGIEELDEEEGSIFAELSASSLPVEEVAQKSEGVSKRNTASKIATLFALLAGAGVVAQTAEAGTLRDVDRGIQRHNNNEMQVERLRGQLDGILLKEEGIIAQIERLEGHPVASSQNQLSTSKEQKMDTGYEAKVAALEVAKLRQVESLAKAQMSDAMRAAKTHQIEAEFKAKLAALADTSNIARERAVGHTGQGGLDAHAVESNEKKILSLQMQLQRLDVQAQQIKMRINDKEVQGTLRTVEDILNFFK